MTVNVELTLITIIVINILLILITVKLPQIKAMKLSGTCYTLQIVRRMFNV